MERAAMAVHVSCSHETLHGSFVFSLGNCFGFGRLDFDFVFLL